MADNDTKSGDQDRFIRESWVGVISAAGMASVLIVIIGRVWTINYFDHFGPPSSGIEFSVYDFAFRSLEALITFVLGAIGFSAAWLSREQLKKWGFISLAIEAVVVAAFLVWVFILLPKTLPDSWLATTGLLGLSGGLALAAMLWLSVDVWQGPGGGVRNWPKRAQHALRRILIRVNSFLRFLSMKGQVNREEAVTLVWRIIAVIILLAIGFLYVPQATNRLAAIEAAADVATGEFPAAILEAEGYLPDAIVSSAVPTKSVPVRVILTESQNTYVLHSTDCTTIGGMDASTTVEGFLPSEAPDVCKVFAIPTSRLKSIEYFQVSGRAPPNESLLFPIEVGLGEEPLKKSFSSDGASDEETLMCAMESQGTATAEDATQELVRFYNSIWYEFTPATNGAVLARVETGEFIPVIGIWRAPKGATDVQRVLGSGNDGSACEFDTNEITLEESADGAGSDVENQTKDVVGVFANVQAGTRYVVSVGAQENGGGSGSVSFEFWPGGYFFNPAAPKAEVQLPEAETTPGPGPVPLGAEASPEGDLVSQARALAPQVEIVSGVGTAKLELWRLDSETYELESLPDIKEDIRDEFLEGEFKLESEGQTPKLFEKPAADEEQPPALSAEGVGEGIWRLAVPANFAGLARLSVAVPQPALVLAFANISGSPLKDVCVQRAVLLVLEEPAIGEQLGYEGNVIFDPESIGEGCQMGVIEDARTDARKLLEDAGFEEGFRIQIQAEEECKTLLAAADIVRQRLLDIGLDAAIEPCTDACIRVLLRTHDRG